MKNFKKLLVYCFTFGLVFFADQITKILALQYARDLYEVNSILSFSVSFNRGISWGILNSPSPKIFWVVTFLVLSVVVFLFFYALSRFKNNKNIISEVIIISGALSNVLDRFIHDGVVDFIMFSYKDWFWPSFNIADACIVVGAFTMIIMDFKEQWTQKKVSRI